MLYLQDEDVEKIKKRAERFGQVSSPLLAKVSPQQNGVYMHFLSCIITLQIYTTEVKFERGIEAVCRSDSAVFTLPPRHLVNGYHLANWAIKISF